MPSTRSLPWILGWAVLALAASAAAGPRTVVVLLFDGFSPAYLESFPTPTFDRLAEEGAFARHMEPAFPTISLINGVTISTGCWPESHGIVSNIFLDPQRGRYDHSSDPDWLTALLYIAVVVALNVLAGWQNLRERWRRRRRYHQLLEERRRARTLPR